MMNDYKVQGIARLHTMIEADKAKTGKRNERLYFKLMKLISESFKARFLPVQTISLSGMVNTWTRYDHDGDSMTKVYVFNTTDRTAVLNALSTITDVDGWHPSRSYDCTGQSFAWAVQLKVQNGRTFATQFVGVDV